MYSLYEKFINSFFWIFRVKHAINNVVVKNGLQLVRWFDMVLDLYCDDLDVKNSSEVYCPMVYIWSFYVSFKFFICNDWNLDVKFKLLICES